MQPGITALILICSAALAKPDCTVDTATDMLAGLDANTPIECLMNSQALVAHPAWRISCKRINTLRSCASRKRPWPTLSSAWTATLCLLFIHPTY